MTVNLISISVGFWGFYLIFKHDTEIKYEDESLVYLVNLVVWMCAIRVMLAVVISFLLLCYLIVFCCLLAMGRYQRNFRHTEHLSRLPLVNTFLQTRARKFDPTKDAGVESCSICMEEFSATDNKEIAELNCNSKHIFHLSCVSQWVANNSICPMCRQPILK